MRLKVPSWLLGHLDEAAFAKIEAAIGMAESKTSGEIVPMVVRRSSTIGHVPIIIFSFILIASLLFDLDDYQRQYLYDCEYWLLINTVIAVILATLCAKSPFIQRLLISKDDRNAQAKQRAELEFYRAGLTETENATGILLFVSMLEHHVDVLADKGIADKLPLETWDEVVRLILNGKKKRNLATGLTDAILKCGELLQGPFPIKDDDKNELRDHLIIKE